jgi:hypothetical protein
MQLAGGLVRVQGAFGRSIHCGEVTAAICVARMRNCLQGSAAAAVVTP